MYSASIQFVRSSTDGGLPPSARALRVEDEFRPPCTPCPMNSRVSSASVLLSLFMGALSMSALVACGDEDDTVDTSDGGADAGSDTQTDADPQDGSGEAECPAGPQSPLDLPCEQEGLQCAYGYDPPECGGRTVICQGGVWIEESHSDPQPSCFDAGMAPD